MLYKCFKNTQLTLDQKRSFKTRCGEPVASARSVVGWQCCVPALAPAPLSPLLSLPSLPHPLLFLPPPTRFPISKTRVIIPTTQGSCKYLGRDEWKAVWKHCLWWHADSKFSYEAFCCSKMTYDPIVQMTPADGEKEINSNKSKYFRSLNRTESYKWKRKASIFP